MCNGRMYRSLLFLLFVAFSVRIMPAQSTTSLRGVVTDPQGSVLPGASVVLSDADSNTQRADKTGAQGEYQFLFLTPGTYSLTVTAAGFGTYQENGLQLLINTPATRNVQVTIASASENVTVTSAAPALNMVDASLGNTFDETQVKEIPLEGRNVPDLLSLQPGVAYTGNRTDIDTSQDTRSGAVNGARSDQSNVSLDGVDVNDQGNGFAFTSVLPVTLDSIQEFRVTTSNYNADQGQGSGAQVALITKSGTDKFHGSFYEYTRNTITSANDYFIKQAEFESGNPNKPLKLIRNIFGASLGGPVKGGPIQMDRLYFFANYEGTRSAENQSVVRQIPTPSLCQGILQYADVNGGTSMLTPNDLQTIDPLHLGINPAVLTLTGNTGYFNKTFCSGKTVTNDNSVGDGLNYSGYRFSAPVSLDNNAFIARFDYHLTKDGKQSIFWRGALQNLSNPQAPFLPGTAPEVVLSDHSKGFAVGYTYVLSQSTVNTFHYGFTRQSQGYTGDSDQAWNLFQNLDQGVTYSHNFQLPVNNLLDDYSWTRGRHTMQFGANIGIARDPRVSYEHSFSAGKGTTGWMSPTGFADTQSPLDPTNLGKPEPVTTSAYDYPMLSLLGMVSNVQANYNYDKTGNVLAAGAPVKRDYGLNWYEFYGQDSVHMGHLTLTYGVRWSLFPPPWEVNGYQASPTTNLGQQFKQNVANMKKGLGYNSAPPVSFILGGAANGKPGFYNFEKSDFAPRLSLAYSLNASSGILKTLLGNGDKSVLSAGVARVYDRAGMQLISTFDQNAPAGLSATIQNPCCIPGVDDAAHVPRISDINTIPVANQDGVVFFQPAPPGAFPQTPPLDGQAITWGIDQSVKTPFAWAMDVSLARELPKGLTLQVSYVGRLGRNLLTQRDLAQPLDLTDTKSGYDYFAAATRLSQMSRAGVPVSQVNDATVGPTAAYWHDMVQPLAAGDQYATANGTTSNVVQAVYSLYVNDGAYAGNEVVGLGNIDLYGELAGTSGNSYYFNQGPGSMLNSQFTSNYAWSSIGTSNFNALQATLRKQMNQGVQFDFNYTYSKSIDITSDASRVGFNAGLQGTALVNAFAPRQARGVSDFDTTHQINADWVAQLPVGRGKALAGNVNKVGEQFIGGWQLSGLARWSSGLPFSVGNGPFWSTDWNNSGLAQMVTKPKTGAFRQPDGSVSAFANPTQAITQYIHPYPGQSGSRNTTRGQGYAGWDMGLSKRWQLPIEQSSLQFRWEVFNVPNLVRFNANSVTNPPSLEQTSFGALTGLLTNPRVMQFALRYEF
jgi:hypothetical protein